MQYPTNPQYARGAFYGLAAVCIWAGFIVVSRLGGKDNSKKSRRGTCRALLRQ